MLEHMDLKGKCHDPPVLGVGVPCLCSLVAVILVHPLLTYFLFYSCVLLHLDILLHLFSVSLSAPAHLPFSPSVFSALIGLSCLSCSPYYSHMFSMPFLLTLPCIYLPDFFSSCLLDSTVGYLLCYPVYYLLHVCNPACVRSPASARKSASLLN
ncbi:hypothetical protein AMECASPLE_011439 [Ameca splendens]|uniref:Uncharacterized protein n=1 Tax=Ameca splendens TaxID=208324 RepID=A0ABV0ZLU5_9TELE